MSLCHSRHTARAGIAGAGFFCQKLLTNNGISTMLVNDAETFKAMVEDLSQYPAIAFDTETSGPGGDGLHLKRWAIGYSVCGWGSDKGYYVPLRHKVSASTVKAFATQVTGSIRASWKDYSETELLEACTTSIREYAKIGVYIRDVGGTAEALAGQVRAYFGGALSRLEKMRAVGRMRVLLQDAAKDAGNCVIDGSIQQAADFMVSLFYGNPSKKIWAHNIKFDLRVVANELKEEREVTAQLRDSMILAWYDLPSRPKGLKYLSKELLGYEMTEFKALGKYADNAYIPVTRITPYAVDDVLQLHPLVSYLAKSVSSRPRATMKAFTDLDMELIEVLDHMEYDGMLIDRARMVAMGEALKWDLEAIEASMRKTLGLKEVRPTSPKWLSDMLVDRLKVWRMPPAIERGKTGVYSSKEAIVEKFASGVYPATRAGREFASLLLTHRAKSKLHGTYTKGLLGKMDENDRVHGSFNQIGTVTGRFSSSDPNLQNIPARSEEGKKIREMFVARPGFVIMDIDYSQIELRLMAHFSKDPAMMAVYREGGDIHQRTANAVGCTRFEAKGVNFGFLYGMGYRKFAETHKVSEEDARRYRARYFKEYAGVKRFQELTKALARKQGYISTIIGRRRYFPLLLQDTPSAGMSWDEFHWRQASEERQSVNTKIQGSAGDLIKVAMRNIVRMLKEHGWYRKDVFLLSQVHDELVFEVRDGLQDEVGPLVKVLMEGAFTLRVPLIADPGFGPSWGEAKL